MELVVNEEFGKSCGFLIECFYKIKFFDIELLFIELLFIEEFNGCVVSVLCYCGIERVFVVFCEIDLVILFIYVCWLFLRVFVVIEWCLVDG